MKVIEDLNLLYGEITWQQTYLAIVVWALELMDNRYQLLRQHMKFKLPSDTKELLKNLNETLDNAVYLWAYAVYLWASSVYRRRRDNQINK